MAEATEQLRIVITAQDQASAVMKNIGGEMNSLLGNVVKGAAAGVGFAAIQAGSQAIGQAFHAAQDAVIGFNASLEQSRIAWATMLGGAQQADAMLQQLQQFATTTPFEFPDVERGARRLLAMGFAARDILPLMTAIGNTASALGAGTEGVDRISLALGQMSTRTKVTGQDMLQLTEVGVPAWQILAQATGQSIAQVQDSAEKGQIASQTFITAFRRFAEANYGGLMQRQSQTFSGAVSNIADSARFALANAFEPMFNGLRDLAIQFSNFLASEGVRNFSQGVRNAQQAVGLFLGTIAEGGPIVTVFGGALAGLATVLGVQVTAAAVRATVALAPLVAAFVAANAPMIALGLAAAAAGVVIAANWDQIVAGTEELRSGLMQKLQDLAEWLSGTLWPGVLGAANAAWDLFVSIPVAALQTLTQVWNAFWGQEIGPSGQTAFTDFQKMAQEGWQGFVNIATAALRTVLELWNAFTGVLLALKLNDVDLGPLDKMAGKFVDASLASKNLGDSLRQVPGIATQAAVDFQKFLTEELPAAFQRAVELVQAAGGQMGDVWGRVQELLRQQAPDLTKTLGDLGKNAGTAFGTGVVQAAKPLLEELQRMLAQLAAGPTTQALEDFDKRIERARLVIDDLTQPLEDRQQALRQIIEGSFQRPRLALQAFDVNEPVRLAQRAESTANLVNSVAEKSLALAQQRAGATGAVAPSAGVTPTGAAAPPPAAAPPAPISLQVVINNADGSQVVYEELLEANGQAAVPQTITVSAVR